MPEKKPSKEPRLRTNSTLVMIPLGLSTSLLEVGTALPYFAAIGMMTTAKVSWIEWFLTLIGYNVIMIVPPVLLLCLYLLFHNWMQRPLGKIYEKLREQKNSTLSWIMCIVGIILIFGSLDYIEL